MDDLNIKDNLDIPGWELWYTASRSGGPGGQHANTTASRVTLHWNLSGTTALTDGQRRRVQRRLRSYINQEGVLSISASDERSQHRNRSIARDRLADMVRGALKRRKRRIPTRPSRSARRRRLEAKRHRGRIKALRKSPRIPND